MPQGRGEYNIAEKRMKHSRRLRPAIILAVLTGISLPLSASADVVVRKSISYFQIGGRTAAELDAELSRKGPFTQASGSRHPGATQIRFGGDLTYALRGNRCAVEDVRVTVDTKLIIPRWKNRNRASQEMATLWDALSSDIKRHEERHAEIARQHAKLLEQRLLKLRPTRDCETLQDRASEVTDEVTVAHDEAQMRFDMIEAKNFQDRMLRILRHRREIQENQ
jgi:predicted secreted Zn-dependent protease